MTTPSDMLVGGFRWAGWQLEGVIVNQALGRDVVVGRLCVHAANHDAREWWELSSRRRELFGLLPRIVGAALSPKAWNARPGGAMNGCGRPERRRVRPP